MAVPGVEDNSLEAVEFAVVFNTSLLLIFFIIFEVLLRKPTVRQQLAPRLAAPERIGAFISRFPYVLPGGFLAWSANLRRRDRLETSFGCSGLGTFLPTGFEVQLVGHCPVRDLDSDVRHRPWPCGRLQCFEPLQSQGGRLRSLLVRHPRSLSTNNLDMKIHLRYYFLIYIYMHTSIYV